MHSEKTVRVKVAKTWDLICRYQIYSCPDTYRFVNGATALLLDAGFENQISLMKVVGVWRLNPACPNQLGTVPDVWRKRLTKYICDIRARRGMLNQSGDYCFYGLAKNAGDDYDGEQRVLAEDGSWPDWMQATAGIRELDVQAALALWKDPGVILSLATQG